LLASSQVTFLNDDPPRETPPIAGFVLDGTKWDGLYPGRHKGKELLHAGKVDHGFDADSAKDLRDPSDAVNPKDAAIHQEGSLIALFGLNWSSLPKSNTGRNPPKGNYATRSTMACGKICDGLPRNAPVLPEPIVMLFYRAI
jgi:hypothetical protein